MRDRDQDQKGFALVVVLGTVLLIALMMAVFARAAQTYIHEMASRARVAEAEMDATAGVNLVVLDLASARDEKLYDRRYPVDGSEVACSLDDGSDLFIRVQDAAGRVNVNLADARLLGALFIGLGASPEAGTRYADRIIDFRDRDDDRRVSGAERDDYLAAGEPRGPKNESFESIDELHQVLGLDPQTITSIEPFITLRSGIAGLDPTATSTKLASILGDGLAQVPNAALIHLSADGVPPEFAMTSSRRIYHALVTARLKGGATFVRESEIDVPPGRGVMPSFKTWRRGRDDDEHSSHASGDLPPC